MYGILVHSTRTYLPTYEDGTDRVFRNDGILNSDAGESPKTKHTTFRTRRKFEIKNNIYMNMVVTKLAYPFPSTTDEYVYVSATRTHIHNNTLTDQYNGFVTLKDFELPDDGFD